MSFIPLEEDIKFTSVCESGSSDPEVLHEPQILHLMPDQHFIKLACEWEQSRFTKPSTWNLHSCSGPSARLPGCLDSLDFRQRMYQASLATRISVSFSRLLLNWVATYRHNTMVRAIYRVSVVNLCLSDGCCCTNGSTCITGNGKMSV